MHNTYKHVEYNMTVLLIMVYKIPKPPIQKVNCRIRMNMYVHIGRDISVNGI